MFFLYDACTFILDCTAYGVFCPDLELTYVPFLFHKRDFFEYVYFYP